jgi:hypothetical protein
MHNNVVSLRSDDIVFRTIDFAIQKGLTTQLVIQLHFSLRVFIFSLDSQFLIDPPIATPNFQST